METAAVIAASLLGLVVVFQIGLALGAPWGAAAWGGNHPGTLPTRLRAASAWVAVVVYPILIDAVTAAGGLTEEAFLWEPGATGMWFLTGFFALGTLANLASRSRPERWWAAVSLGIAVCCAVIARGL